MADRVLIMSSNPGQIVGSLEINLEFPRNRNSDEFIEYRSSLMDLFDGLVGDSNGNKKNSEQDKTNHELNSSAANRAAA
jgi:hypothetical protein